MSSNSVNGLVDVLDMPRPLPAMAKTFISKLPEYFMMKPEIKVIPPIRLKDFDPGFSDGLECDGGSDQHRGGARARECSRPS